ncbi:hypothetical protein F9C07_1507 [Aspergillus flavus]|uniref:Uncharacterized protein n=4 Tax=Aspergillus subgen. Circumdati TaxID=2720871 RepID=A0A7U2QY50_ASPFN|nr:hypothetical protein F9C07_1507 [Aspergillus flavus]GMF80314.1 unnamed protein product [Aspergillus oryzae]GMG54812.1 unnamed protein product [Aspergillus oryzae var. brunneus]UCK57921.1 hypothetical protein AFCA_000801 [Aspergillus flavus]GMF95782.1 unnamed protein product [Aspergillus oryzae]
MATDSRELQLPTATSQSGKSDITWEHLEDVSAEHKEVEHPGHSRISSATKSRKAAKHVGTMSAELANIELTEKPSLRYHLAPPAILIIPPSPSDENPQETSGSVPCRSK